MTARPARVVVVGATGLLGARLTTALSQLGVPLLCVHSGRTAQRPMHGDAGSTAWLAADLRAVPDSSFWRGHLRAGDVVVNAAGVLREDAPGLLAAVHHAAPAALFDACAAVGAACVIQVSALGAHPDAPTPFLATKGQGDEHLLTSRVRGVVVRPSLIWAGDGPSARMFAALAALPLLVLPAGGHQAVQPVHIDDVIAGLVALVLAPERAPAAVIDLVGPLPLTLAAYLAQLRVALGLRRRQQVLSVSPRLFVLAARLLGALGSQLVNASSARMLLAGSAAPSGPVTALLGHAPRAPVTFLSARQGASALSRARLFWLWPALRLSVALVWLWTAAVSAGLYPVSQSLTLLESVGASAPLARVLLPGAVTFDLLLGLGSLAAPARWRARIVWPLQLAVMAVYTAILSWALPQFWLHPFGPLSKNLPMAAAVAMLWAVDARARSASARQ